MNDDDNHDVAVGGRAAGDMTPESAFNSPRFDLAWTSDVC